MIESAERDLEFFREKLAEISKRENDLINKLTEDKNTAEQNENTLKELQEQELQLKQQLAAPNLSIEKLENAAAHVERLCMQLEDNLSTERQAMEMYSSAGKVHNEPCFWERAAAIAITVSILVASIAAVRKYFKRK